MPAPPASPLQRLRQAAVYRPAGPAAAWTEALLLSALGLALGRWLRPADPYFLAGPFSWLALPPLLVGLRYGFAPALASAGLLAAAAALAGGTGATALGLGLLAVAVVSGEFRDQWHRRLDRLQAAADYCRRRMDELSRAYHVLKVSHDALERQVAARTATLRDCVLGIRRQLLQAPTTERALLGLGPVILRQLATYASLQSASLHRVEGSRVEASPLATFGPEAAAPLDPEDPLLREALEQRQAVSLRPELLAGGGEEAGGDRYEGRLLAAVPLVDVQGRLWALLAVRQMPFRAFNRDNLRLLAVLAGHVGDLLTRRLQGLVVPLSEAHDFVYELERCLADARAHGLEAVVLALRFKDRAIGEDLAQVVLGSHRGLDQGLALRDRDGDPAALLLLPLTDERGAQGYLSRLARMVKEQFAREGLEEAGVLWQLRLLRPGDRRAALLAELLERGRLVLPEALRPLLRDGPLPAAPPPGRGRAAGGAA